MLRKHCYIQRLSQVDFALRGGCSECLVVWWLFAIEREREMEAKDLTCTAFR